MRKGKILTSIFTIVGVVLILSSAFLMVYSNLVLENYAEESRKTAEKIQQMMPEKIEEYTKEYHQSMSVFEIGGVDYIGVIDIPANKGTLPVAAYWDESSIKKYPCRYFGSIYDDLIVIGGNDSNGQFAIVKTLSIGQKIVLTSISGEVFTYTVKSVEIYPKIAQENLKNKNNNLILFVKNSIRNDYVVVSCDLK